MEKNREESTYVDMICKIDTTIFKPNLNTLCGSKSIIIERNIFDRFMIFDIVEFKIAGEQTNEFFFIVVFHFLFWA